MNNIKLIEKSIEKWVGVLDGAEENSTDDCALCERYWEDDCMECPIYEHTDNIYCKSTPYYAWAEHHNEFHFVQFCRKIHCEECKELAQKEFDFLKEILIKE